MLNEKKTGPIASSDGAVNPARTDRQGADVATQAHGEYNEAVVRDNVFMASTQVADTWDVALTLNPILGVIVSNPPGSNKNLSILKVGFAQTTACANEASIHLAGGYVADGGITVHDTPLVVYNMKLGSPAAAVAFADDEATAVAGSAVYLLPLIGGFTAGATLPAGPMATTDIGGLVMVPPGGYVFIAALTAVVGFGCIVWEEIPR